MSYAAQLEIERVSSLPRRRVDPVEREASSPERKVDGALRSALHASYSAHSDETLMSLVISGQTAALEALYDRHAGAVLGFITKIVRDRETGEDVLQEVFLRVWSRASSFESSRGSFSAWLFSIARNLCISHLRQQRARPQIFEDSRIETDQDDNPLEGISDPAPSIPETIWLDERSQLVQAALAALPDEQRLVIELSYFEGLTRREIAARLGWPEGTVHTRARLGLQKLAMYLAAHGVGPEDLSGGQSSSFVARS